MTDPTLDDARDARARAAAQTAVEALTVAPTGIVQYTSQGRVVVIGGEDAQVFASHIEPPLRAQVVLTGGVEEPGVPVIPVAGRELVISGHLGAFELRLGEQGRPNHEVVKADMVLDLGEVPYFQRSLPPPGYWHVSDDFAEQDRVLASVRDMVGTFEKPRFFDYDPDICAHSRSGQQGCDRCIRACPAEAITEAGDGVEVNPNLCQGGGVCATVCPSGAIRYAYPGPGDTQERVRLLVRRYLEAGGRRPVLVVASEADAAVLDSLPANQLLLVVEELGSVGLELWLAALAWGADYVLLLDGGSVPAEVRAALEGQVAVAEALLRGLGCGPGAVRLAATPALEAGGETPLPAEREHATFGAMNDKRRVVEFALDHLRSAAPAPQEVIELPTHAPFGQILVDTEACTLCMGCVSVCPANALEGGGDEPRLDFREPRCLQCGMCERACPENAIRLEARYLTDPEERRQARVLCRQEPFHCVSCGKAFGTQAVIGQMLARLAGHHMFQSERARRRLQMCEDCRVVDAVQDPEAMQAGAAHRPGRQGEPH